MKEKRSNLRLSDELAIEIGLTPNSCGQYRVTKEQVKQIDKLKHFKARKSAELDNEPFETTKHYWIKEKGLSRFVKVEQEQTKLNLDDLKTFIKKLNITTKSELKPIKSNKTLRIIITDVHVGMQPKENNYSLYDYVWNAEELEKRRLKVIQDVIDLEQDFEEIHLIDLGDLTDGFNAETTRGGHKLPQNMTNRQQFETAFKFKTTLLLQLQDTLNEVRF